MSASSSSMILHLQTVPARNGALWVRHGLKVFQRKPLALTGLFGIFMFLGFALMLVPALGPLLLLATLPLVSLGFMLATHQVLQAQTPTVAVFVAPLQLTPERRRTQLTLGAAYALATVAIMFFSDWVDGGSFAALQELLGKGGDVDEAALEAALAEPRLLWGAVTRLGLATLLSIPFWHAPALVHWGGQGALQALFSSTLGVWRNKTAFALSAACWGGLALGFSSLLTLVLSLLGLGKLLPMLMLPAGLMLSTMFYSSLYFTFVDCFMFGAPRDLLSEKR
ncbi:BPSS1780 family membrane protein [Paucibacter sediminis]|uniref:BPSS1780 family membrane protein n=1 Tax=Paucibacter sediminis TaxID=3019553 RepID=A0AA95NG77_9BURK|nr:BPSS1780 family membrane protein [Paucibacter sp. S2-9]WIT10231.1 BPSS1780 family membrane protein [Paucibacter sp. S2-9]